MKTLRCFLLLALVAAAAGNAFTQTLTKTGTTSAAILKIGIGPRAIGMGGAFAATADDISALYWNPGGLGSSYGNEAMFNHTFWFADISVDYAAVTSRIGDFGTLGAFVTTISHDEMAVRTVDQPRGTGEFFDAGAMVVGLSYGRNLTDNFGIGFTVKYVREDIWHSTATGVALDVGVLYRIDVLNELRLAASVANFGTKMQMEGIDNLLVTQIGGATGNLVNTNVEVEKFDLPLLFRVGVAADVIREEENRLTLEVDAVHPNDNTEYLNTGAEYGWNDILFLRAGWKSLFERDTEQGWTVGAGLHYRVVGSVKVKVDYAYQDFGRLSEVQYLSLAVVF
jgi:opacity protein-like surface antigen